MMTTTKSLQEEATKMAAVAAAAAKKAQQRKVTDFMVSSPKGGQGTTGGAGELPSGPCGLTNPGAAQAPVPTTATATTTAAPAMPGMVTPGSSQSLTEGVMSVLQQMRHLQEQQGQEAAAIRVLEQTSGGGEPSKKPDEEEDQSNWQIWTNRKNRRIGGDLEVQEPRQVRGETPFKLPGQSLSGGNKGYYTSSYRRDQARMDARGSNQSSAAAALTDRQWFWFKKRLCLCCGMDHQVKDCPDVARREEGFALLRAAFSCPPDMRPGGKGPGSGTGQSRGQPKWADRRMAATPGTAAAARAPPSASSNRPPTAATGTTSKRSREQAEQGSSGLTPEAKKSRPFSDAAKASLTLYVRERDGTALTEERYLSLKTSFAYYVEDMMSKNKDPPICSGRWTFNRSVVKVPMAGELDLLWMRCFLDKAYLVQNEEDFNKSKGKIYVAYLRDRLEPELTGMRSDKLASFVKYFKGQAKIGGLFDLKMAAKTPKGKAVHLVMDEEAEKIFIREGCKIPFASAGWVTFEDRVDYVARIKKQERNKLRPKPSNLEKGLREQAMDVDKMTVDREEEEEVVEVGRTTRNPGTPAAAATAPSGASALPLASSKGVGLDEAKEIAAALKDDVKTGKLELGTAEALMLEKTGLSLHDLTPRRTVSASSWSEEVEMAKNLSVPETVSEEAMNNNDDENDRALFELQQEQDVQDGHRAVGSAGLLAEGAAGSPSS